MREKLGDEDMKMVNEAALIIWKSFTWLTSMKGQGYWEDVFKELIRIAATGEP